MTGQIQTRILPAKIDFDRHFDHNTTTSNGFEYSLKCLRRLIQLFAFISRFFRMMKQAQRHCMASANTALITTIAFTTTEARKHLDRYTGVLANSMPSEQSFSYANYI